MAVTFYTPTIIPSGAFRGLRPLPFREVVFMSSWYRSPVASRDPELRLCFWLNSHHTAYTRRIWFVEAADEAKARAAVERGEIVGDIQVLPESARGRLRFGDAFRLARERFPVNAIFVLANSDIAIPASSVARLAALAALPRVAICLSRHDVDLKPAATRRLVAELPRLSGPEVWASVLRSTRVMDTRRGSRSQDVWVWHGSVRPSLARIDAIPLGKPGCDNAVAHHLTSDAKVRLLNPYYHAKTYHIHDSAVRHYTAKDRIPPPYAGVPYSILPGDPGHPAAAVSAARSFASAPRAAPRKAPSLRAAPRKAPSLRAATQPAPSPRAATQLAPSQRPRIFVSRRTSPIHATTTAAAPTRRDLIRREQGPIFIGYV